MDNFAVRIHSSQQPLDIESVIEALEGISSFDCLFELDGQTAVATEEIKWYEHEEDMSSLSLLYPDAIFELITPDGGQKFFWNGMVQRGYLVGDLVDTEAFEEVA